MAKSRSERGTPPKIACPRCGSVRIKGVLRDEPVGYIQCRVCDYVWSLNLKKLVGIRFQERRPRS